MLMSVLLSLGVRESAWFISGACMHGMGWVGAHGQGWSWLLWGCHRDAIGRAGSLAIDHLSCPAAGGPIACLVALSCSLSHAFSLCPTLHHPARRDQREDCPAAGGGWGRVRYRLRRQHDALPEPQV